MNNKGMTLVEILVSLPILLAIFGTVMGLYITMDKLFPGGIRQATFQSQGRTSLSRVADEVRVATTATINSFQDVLTIVKDPNNTFSNPGDDITSRFSIISGNLIYDPDITVADNDLTLLQNVQQEQSIPYFQITGNLVVITFKVAASDSLLGTQSSAMSTSVKMRNNNG